MHTEHHEKQTPTSALAELIPALLAKLVSVGPEAVDAEIVAAQRQVCEATGLDRVTLFQLQADGQSLASTHTWPLDPPEPTVRSSDLPFLSAMVFRREVIHFNSRNDLPEEARKDRDWIAMIGGPVSNVTIPLVVGDRVFGAVAFSMLTHERVFEAALVEQFRVIAGVFASTIVRTRLWLELQSNAEQVNLAVDAAKLGLWSWDAEGRMWASPRTRELLGVGADESVVYEQFLTRLHTEDRARVKAAMMRAIHERSEYCEEYRVQQADGGVRWVLSHGRCCKDKTGRAYEVVGVLQDITETRQTIDRLANAFEEIRQLRDRLQNENMYLQEEAKQYHGQIIGRSTAIREVLRQVEQVAASPTTVLIQGETGTGKELVAQAIHDASRRKDRPMIKVNCAAIPAALMESEFFGREKGAYTGALSRQPGRFELADGSTIFLDEVGEIPLELQAKLLRVLQEKQFERLGSPRPVSVDVRIIAATNRDLQAEVRAGRFREDLYYRLSVFPITVPPLRERVDDIPLLASAFLREFGATLGKQFTGIARSSMDAALGYPWPGNVRELRNVVERAAIVATGTRVRLEPPATIATGSSKSMMLEDVEKAHILQVLQDRAWRIRGAGGAAEALGMKPTTLESRMKKLGIRRVR